MHQQIRPPSFFRSLAAILFASSSMFYVSLFLISFHYNIIPSPNGFPQRGLRLEFIGDVRLLLSMCFLDSCPLSKNVAG